MWTFIQHQLEQAIDHLHEAKVNIGKAELRAKDNKMAGAQFCAMELRQIIALAQEVDTRLRTIALYTMEDAKIEAEATGEEGQ
jgi:hypothetical protein